jgi:hypothetical protein
MFSIHSQSTKSPGREKRETSLSNYNKLIEEIITKTVEQTVESLDSIDRSTFF